MLHFPGLWFTTRSALFDPGERGWAEIARYGPVIRRYLSLRFPRMPLEDREDIAQQTLVAMREQLVQRHDPERGRFRQLLQTCLNNRVRSHYRKVRPRPLNGEAQWLLGPTSDEVEALDLEATLLEAVARVRDALTGDDPSQLEVLYALADRIVHGRSNKEIAGRTGCSIHAVARVLRKGRALIHREILALELGSLPPEPQQSQVVEAFREALQRPRGRRRILEQLGDLELEEQLDDLLERIGRSLEGCPAHQSPEAHEFRRGLEIILGGG